MKKSLQKSLLMALLLLVGSSAWADVGDEVINAKIDFSTPITDGKVVGTVNGIVIPDGAGEIRGESGWLSLYDGTSTITIPAEERAGAFDAVNVQFKMAWGNKNGMGSGFNLKDADGEVVANFQLARWDGSSTNSNTLGIDDIYDHIGTHYNNAPINDRYTLFDITVDYATRKITTVLTCMNPSNTATYVVDLTNTNQIATFELYGYNVDGNTDRASVVDDILIKTIEGDANVAFADYTVKFVDQNGDQVKESVVRNNIVGESVEVKDEEKATFVVGNAKYVYVEDDAEGKTIAEDGSTVVTVKFQKIVVSEYTVNYLDAEGNVLQEATIHKEIETGTEVSASAGEQSKILVDGVIYNYVSGNKTITVAENETQNVINLVFEAEEGVVGYLLQTFEQTKTVDGWSSDSSDKGRYAMSIVAGSSIPSRYGTKVIQEAIVDSLGNAVLDSLGQPTYRDVTVTDSTVVYEFANKTNFAAANQDSRNNNGATITLSSWTVDQTDFTFEAKVLLGYAGDQKNTEFILKNYAGSANYLSIKQPQDGSNMWTINGETTVALPNSGTYTGTTNANLNNYSWCDLKVTVSKGYTFVTITDEEGNVLIDKLQVSNTATTYGVGNIVFVSGRYNANFAIDDILVRSVSDDDIPSDFNTVAVTIKYEDAEGNSLKPADTVEFSVGDVVSLTSAYTSDFKVDAEGAVWTSESENAPVTKYIYVSDNSAEVVAEEGASVTVVFRGVAPRIILMRYQYQNAETGEMMTKNAAGTNLPFFYDSRETGDVLFEGDVQRIYYPYYLLVDGYLYKTGANSGDADHYDLTVTAGTSNLLLSPVTWTVATEEIDGETLPITNAVFAEESENIPGMTVIKDQYTTIRQANGAAGSAIGGDVLVTTLMPGKYTITTASRSGTTNFLVDGEVVCTVSTSGTVTTVTSEEFEVTKPTPLYIEEQSGTSQYSDYVLIRKTGDVEDPSYVVLSNYALASDGEFDEDGFVKIVVNYSIDLAGSYADTESFEHFLSVAFTYDIIDAEGNVASGEQTANEVTDGYVNLYPALTPNSEYTINITSAIVYDYMAEDMIAYTEAGALPSLTFTTGSISTGIVNIDATPAVKADGKYLENGQIVIYRGGVKYNAAGAVIR